MPQEDSEQDLDLLINPSTPIPEVEHSNRPSRTSSPDRREHSEPTSATHKRKHRKVDVPRSEQLQQQQIDLLRKQVECFERMELLLEKRNEIEREKLIELRKINERKRCIEVD